MYVCIIYVIHRGEGFYWIYHPSDDSRHRNHTEVYNALLPPNALLRDNCT